MQKLMVHPNLEHVVLMRTFVIVLVIVLLLHDINGENSCHKGIWIHLENQK
jgi:hypothetical protein